MAGRGGAVVGPVESLGFEPRGPGSACGSCQPFRLKLQVYILQLSDRCAAGESESWMDGGGVGGDFLWLVGW